MRCLGPQWIIEYELFIFLLTAAATIFPARLLHRIRPVALTFMASALVLVMDNINAICELNCASLPCLCLISACPHNACMSTGTVCIAVKMA